MNEDTGYETIRFKGLANECESSCRFVSQLMYYVNLLALVADRLREERQDDERWK